MQKKGFDQFVENLKSTAAITGNESAWWLGIIFKHAESKQHWAHAYLPK